MSPDALTLVLAGAFAHALWNYLAKRASGGQSFVWLYGLVSFAFSAPLCLWFVLSAPELMNWQLLTATLVSASLHLAYSLALQRGYQVGDLTVVYPVARGTGALFSVFGAILILSERPSLSGWTGIGMVFFGILLIAGGRRFFSATVNAGSVRGLFWGILTGLLIASFTVIDGWSVKTLLVSPLFFYSLCLSFRTFLLAPLALRDIPDLQQQWRTNWRYIIAVGFLAPTSYTLVLFAMTLAPLSYVAPLRQLSMLIAAWFGAKLLMEEDPLLRITATGMMAIGIVILTLS